MTKKTAMEITAFAALFALCMGLMLTLTGMMNARKAAENFRRLPTTGDAISAEMESRGNVGRCLIEELGINIALFLDSDEVHPQEVVDNEDSALMYDAVNGNTIICDHNYQGLGAITKGELPTMRIVTAEGETSYTCVERVLNGINNGSIAYPDGTPVYRANENSLVLYTCNDNGIEGSITITVWKEV